MAQCYTHINNILLVSLFYFLFFVHKTNVYQDRRKQTKQKSNWRTCKKKNWKNKIITCILQLCKHSNILNYVWRHTPTHYFLFMMKNQSSHETLIETCINWTQTAMLKFHPLHKTLKKLKQCYMVYLKPTIKDHIFLWDATLNMCFVWILAFVTDYTQYTLYKRELSPLLHILSLWIL